MNRSIYALTCVALVGCQEESTPHRYPPRPPPPPAYGPPPPPPAPAPAPAAPTEAGRISLVPALLVGGVGMSDPQLDQATRDFTATFNAGVSLFRQCYARGFARNRGLRGSVKAKVTIDANAQVVRVEQMRTELADQEVVACALDAFRRLRYARPGGQLFAAEAEVEFEP